MNREKTLESLGYNDIREKIKTYAASNLGKIKTITQIGINIHTNTKVGEDIEFEELLKKHDAVYTAIAEYGEDVEIRGSKQVNDMTAKIMLERRAKNASKGN